MFENLERQVELFCPLCGQNHYEALDDVGPEQEEFDDNFRLRCTNCKNVFTKRKLMEANRENFEANYKEISKEVVKEISREVRKWKF